MRELVLENISNSFSSEVLLVKLDYLKELKTMCETALCDTITQDNVLGIKILTLSHVSAFLFA